MTVWRIARWRIVRRRSARRVATQLVASAAAAAIAVAGLATTAAAQDGFTDVDSRSHQANIEALAEMGLFEGTECGEQQFCPDEPANRWTVAVWIVRALHGGNPPEVAESRFADVDDDEWWVPYVERLADLGITVGCKTEPFRFCPDETVTRARMASFLARAFDLAEAPSAGFADTGGSSHEANIDALFAAGITVGCSQDPLLYCPNNPVSRAQNGHPAEARPEHTPRGRLRHDRSRTPQRRHTAGGHPGAYLRSPTRQHGGLLGRRGGPPGAHERLGTERRRRAEHRPGPDRRATHVCGTHRWNRLLLGARTRGAARAGQHRDPPSAGGGARHRRRNGCSRRDGLHLRCPR